MANRYTSFTPTLIEIAVALTTYLQTKLKIISWFVQNIKLTYSISCWC